MFQCYAATYANCLLTWRIDSINTDLKQLPVYLNKNKQQQKSQSVSSGGLKIEEKTACFSEKQGVIG